MKKSSEWIVETVEIMDERGNQTSDIVWDIAVHGSHYWELSERLKLAWQIIRGKP